MMSAEKPTGVVKRFARPHETPIARELAELREKGHFFCAIAVVTEVLACKKAKPTISAATERTPLVLRPVISPSSRA